MVSLEPREYVAPFATAVSVLSLRLPLTVSVPASIRVGPLYVLDPLNVSVPLPLFLFPPVPEITPENVVFAFRPPLVSSELPRLIAPDPSIDPTVSSADSA